MLNKLYNHLSIIRKMQKDVMRLHKTDLNDDNWQILIIL